MGKNGKDALSVSEVCFGQPNFGRFIRFFYQSIHIIQEFNRYKLEKLTSLLAQKIRNRCSNLSRVQLNAGDRKFDNFYLDYQHFERLFWSTSVFLHRSK